MTTFERRARRARREILGQTLRILGVRCVLCGETAPAGPVTHAESSSSPRKFVTTFEFSAGSACSAVKRRFFRALLVLRYARNVYYLTLTVITEQVPGNVLCRSSPSCRASLCFPGVS